MIKQKLYQHNLTLKLKEKIILDSDSNLQLLKIRMDSPASVN